jgi:hypothetical protein
LVLVDLHTLLSPFNQSKMFSSTTLLTLLAAVTAVTAQNVTGSLGDAPIIKDNIAGAQYLAVFNTSTVKGVIVATSMTASGPVDFHLQVGGLPEGKGPFSMSLSHAQLMMLED